MAFACMCALLLISVSSASAQAACSNTWTGTADDGLWGTGSNWSTGVAPGAGNITEDVCLPTLGSAYTVTLTPFTYEDPDGAVTDTADEPEIDSLSVAAGAKLLIEGENSTETSGSGHARTQLISTNGGTIAAGGALELEATTNNEGSGSGGGVAALVGSAPLVNQGSLTFAQADMTNQDQLGINVTDQPGSSAEVLSGTLNITDGTTFTNDSTFTVDSDADDEVDFNDLQTGPSGFINDGAYINNGTTTVQQSGNSQSYPEVWTQRGGSATGNPVVLQNGSELTDAAGTGSFLFDTLAGQLSGTIPAGQTVTVQADANGPQDGNLTSMTLDGSQVVNQGTLVLHSPAVSTNTQSSIRISGAQLVNQGTITATSDAANLTNEVDVALANQHGASLNITNGRRMVTGGQLVTNDGTISIAPTASYDSFANEFLTGPETLTNAADGTIALAIASATAFGSFVLDADSVFNAGGTVTPQLQSGFTPAASAEFRAFPIVSTPTINGTFGTVSGGFSGDYQHETTSPGYIGLVYGAVTGTSSSGTGTTGSGTTSPSSKLSYGRPSIKSTVLHLTLSCSPGKGCVKTTVQETIRVRVRGHRILGIATTTAKSTAKIKIKVLVLATHTATLGAGKHATLNLALDPTGRALLARFHRLRVSVTARTRGKVARTFQLTLVRSTRKRTA